MSSTIIIPLAEYLAALVATVTLPDGTTLKGYTWEPAQLDEVPAGCVGPPRVRRTPVEEADSQVGADDWFFDFPVSLYFDLDEAEKTQTQMVEGLEAFVSAVDADPSLGETPTVLDAKVTQAEPFVSEGRGRSRPLVGYECTVSVFRLVPTP